MSRLLKLALSVSTILLSGCTIVINLPPSGHGCFVAIPENSQPVAPNSKSGSANAQDGSSIVGKMPTSQAMSPTSPRPSNNGAPATRTPTALGTGTHGCALFGGSIPGVCQNYPAWTDGTWQPPVGVKRAHVLLVGGGGGGAANEIRGIGGTG